MAGNGQEKESSGLKCFVVIGFGTKTDLGTGRRINLDNTFTKLIKPALENAGVECFRAIDKNLGGSIDVLMYRWLYEADIVVADLSTLNANVFYELGVRYSQRPNTTILIAESELLKNIPFDLSHIVIHSYQLAGEEITDEEAARFVEHLTRIVRALIEDPQPDSPVYTYLRDVDLPHYAAGEERGEEDDPNLAALFLERGSGDRLSLSQLIELAETAAAGGDYEAAIARLGEAMQRSPNDSFLTRQLALYTFKAQDDAADNGSAIQSLKKADEILQDLRPDVSTDPETLSLAGAVHKRLWDRTEDSGFLEKARRFYERAYHIRQDHSNGANAALMYSLEAKGSSDPIQEAAKYGHAHDIWERLRHSCERLAGSSGFEARPDRRSIYETLALAYLATGREEKIATLIPKIEGVTKHRFDLAAFKERHRIFFEDILEFRSRHLRVAAVGGEGFSRFWPEAGRWGRFALPLLLLLAVAATALIGAWTQRSSASRTEAALTERISRLDERLTTIHDRVSQSDREVRIQPGGGDVLNNILNRIDSLQVALSRPPPNELLLQIRSDLTQIQSKLESLATTTSVNQVNSQINSLRLELSRMPDNRQLTQILSKLESIQTQVSRSLTIESLNQIITQLNALNRMVSRLEPSDSTSPHIQFDELRGLEPGFVYDLENNGDDTRIRELNLILRHPGKGNGSSFRLSVLTLDQEKLLHRSTEVSDGSRIEFQHGRYDCRILLRKTSSRWQARIRLLVPRSQ